LLTNSFIDHEAFPSYLMEDFLEIVPAGCFSWYAYLVLFKPRFSWLVEKAGGLEVLAEHVDAAAGFQEVAINGFMPVNVRAQAALCEYKPLRNNNRYYGFDFMY